MRADKARIDVYVGSPIEDRTELRFLSRLRKKLEVEGLDAVILANFHIGGRRRQVDFVVATADHASAVEIKGYRLAVRGGVDGPWSLTQPDGSLRPILGQSPYHQALSNRFAVSDALKVYLSDGLDARDCLSGMLCCYPEQPPGSQLPVSDRKLAIGGWHDFETVVGLPCRRRLPLSDWRGFAVHLGLVPEGTLQPTSDAALLADYRDRVRELAAAVDGPLIAPSFEIESGALPPDILALVENGRQFILLGPSGVGKTRLLASIAADACASGKATIVIRARDFNGDFASLLRKGIACGTSAQLGTFLGAIRSTGTDLLLCVDALNECKPGNLPDLIAALQAFRLRHDATVILTGQDHLTLPPLLEGSRYLLKQPARDRAGLLVEAYLGRALIGSERSALDLVATAQDATVLASTLSTPGSCDGRYALYDRFTRELLPEAWEASIHAALATLATSIRAELRPLIATTTARRILRHACPECPPDTIESVLTDGRLLVSENGHSRFRHDLFTDYFAATDLLLRAPNDSVVIEQARRPFYAELREFLLGGSGRAVQDALITSEFAARLFAGVLRGRAGQALRSRLLASCQDLLDRVSDNFQRLSFSLPDVEQPQYLDVTSPRPLEFADHEMMLWHALPVAAEEGLLSSILGFAGAVDRLIAAEVDRLRLVHPEVRIFRHLAYNTMQGMWASTSEVKLIRSLVADLQNRFGEVDAVDIPGQLAKELDLFEQQSPTQLLVLLAMVRGSWRQMPHLPTRLAELLSHCWNSRIYHVRLLATDMVYLNGWHFEPELKVEVAELMNSWLGDNAWLNTIIFDALKSVDGVDFAVDVDTIVEEYRRIASKPIDDEVSKEAMSAYYRTWDGPDPEPYSEAFYERLPAEARHAVLIRAIANTEQDMMSVDFALRELPNPLPKEAIAVVEQYASLPIEPSISIQSAVAVFAGACASLARSGLPLPATPRSCDTSIDAAAWQGVAPLLHAFNRIPPAAQTEIDGHWLAFADFGADAIMDVVYRTSRDTPMFGTRAAVSFLDRCSAQMRLLALSTLDPKYRPSSLFNMHRDTDELLQTHREFAFQILAIVGKLADIALVRAWIDHTHLGEDALGCARKLEARGF